MSYPKQRFSAVKSKLRTLVLGVHGRTEDDYENDDEYHEYDYEYGPSDSDDSDLEDDFTTEQYERYIEQLERERYQQRWNEFGRKLFGGGRVRGL